MIWQVPFVNLQRQLLRAWSIQLFHQFSVVRNMVEEGAWLNLCV